MATARDVTAPSPGEMADKTVPTPLPTNTQTCDGLAKLRRKAQGSMSAERRKGEREKGG